MIEASIVNETSAHVDCKLNLEYSSLDVHC